jgi:hypothetical protein
VQHTQLQIAKTKNTFHKKSQNVWQTIWTFSKNTHQEIAHPYTHGYI